MKKQIYRIIFLFILFLIQTALLKVFPTSIARLLVPELVLVFIIVHAVYFSSSFPETLWLAMLAGFFIELVSGLFFGTYMAALSLTGIASYLLTRKIASQEAKIPTVILLVSVATVFYAMLGFLYNQSASSLSLAAGPGFRNFLSAGIFLTILSNLIVFYPIMWIYEKSFSN